MIKKIREYVKNNSEENDWKYHIVPVINYVKKLAKKMKVDEKITELTALLHDIMILAELNSEARIMKRQDY